MIDRSVVAVDAFLGRTLLLEFRNIGTRYKSFAASPGDDDDANIFVLPELFKKPRCRLPHFEGNGVVALRIVEGQVTDLAFFVRQHRVGLRHPLPP